MYPQAPHRPEYSRQATPPGLEVASRTTARGRITGDAARRGKVVAIAAGYASSDGKLQIGGVQTYLTQLAAALRGAWEFLIYQPADRAFERDFADLRAVGRPVANCQALTEHVVLRVLGQHDLLLFSTEQLNAASSWTRSIVIQHGIYWDLPVAYYTRGKLAHRFGGAYKLFDNWRNLRRIRGHQNVVCVDYAYATWLRSITDGGAGKVRIWTIPNNAGSAFFQVGPASQDGAVAILFARRFMTFRGTLLFARVAARLLERHGQARVTLCGEGPDEAKMKEILPPSKRVRYCRVEHSEMPAMLREHHIVVVPSLGSEGTSLSAIEGLAAGRAVVASAVGGIPNIILDGFNGRLVPPNDEESLYQGLQSLIESHELRD